MQHFVKIKVLLSEKGFDILGAGIEELRTPPPNEFLERINGPVVRRCLDEICTLNQQRLLDMLSPHAGSLDLADPARFIIDWKRGQDGSREDVATEPRTQGLESLKDPYILGVAFARFLVTSALHEGEDLPPVIAFDFDQVFGPIQPGAAPKIDQKQEMVKKYLIAAKARSVQGLSKRDIQHNPDLQKALDSFCQHCTIQLRGTMAYGGEEAIRRGCIDLLNVISLLVSSEPERRRLFRRTQGFSQLSRHLFGLL